MPAAHLRDNASVATAAMHGVRVAGKRRKATCRRKPSSTLLASVVNAPTIASYFRRSWVTADDDVVPTDAANTPRVASSSPQTIRDQISPHKIQVSAATDAHLVADKTITVNKNNNGRVSPHAVLNGGGGRLLTDYFPTRRSGRRTKRSLDEERELQLRRRLADGDDNGLSVRQFAGKGRGVVATQAFARGEFVVEYAGELVDTDEARRREALYGRDAAAGCYMYYFQSGGRGWCVDGTRETGRLGRLVNHSRLTPNLCTRPVSVNGRPRLVLLAKRDISVGEELLYDYGDRSKQSIIHHPWLAS